MNLPRSDGGAHLEIKLCSAGYKTPAKIPVQSRIAKTNQYEPSAAAGVQAVRIALAANVYPTTDRPPSHSANIPPGSDVTKYPQKYEPSKKLC